MNSHRAFSATCPMRELLDQLTDKWSLLALIAVVNEPIRFNALKRSIEGISQKVLTQTLRKLEYNGLVSRTIYPTVPVTVEYAITPMGKSLVELIQPLREWIATNLPNIQKARAGSLEMPAN